MSELRFKMAFVMLIVALASCHVSAGSACAQELSAYSTPPAAEVISDIFPPTITVISPARGETLATSTPVIQVAFEDLGSGIDESTIHLAVDRADVTSQAEVEDGRITYRPSVPLARGTHEAYFGVRDKAGNLAEVRWTFDVMPFFEGMRVGGRNILKIERYPISKITDSLDMTLQAKVADSDVRLRVQGRGTDYPGGVPIYTYDEYNLFLDKYSLEVRHGSSSIAVGFASVPIESEILQVSREARGGVANTIIRVPSGQHDISAFYGKIASSSGLGLKVYDIAGVTERWKAKTGLTFGGMYATLGGNDGYHVLSANGRLTLANRGALRFEVVGGASKTEDVFGCGLALHFDMPFRSSSLGVDLVMLEPDYPLPGTPPSLSPDRGGIVRYGFRTMTRISTKSILTLNGAFTRDNLDGSAHYTLNRRNLAVSYYYPVSPTFNLRAVYQGDLKQSDDLPDLSVDSIAGTASLTASMQLGRGQRRSSLQATYTAGAAEDRVSGKSSGTTRISGSWSMPVGTWTLSSTLDLSRNETLPDATRTDTMTGKVTGTGQVVPKVLQGAFTLFRTGSDKFEGHAPDPTLRKTETGLETTLRATVLKSSTLSLVFQNSWWTQQDTTYREGQNRTLNLEWAVSF